MEKNKFISSLKNKTSYSVEVVTKIVEIIESHNIIGRKNKEKIIKDLMNSLNIDKKEANGIYNTCMDIIVKKEV